MFEIIGYSLEGRYNDQARRPLRFNYLFNSPYPLRRSDRCTTKLQNFHYVTRYNMKMHLTRCTIISCKNNKNKVKGYIKFKLLNKVRKNAWSPKSEAGSNINPLTSGFRLPAFYSYPSFSSLLRIEKIKIADVRQQMINTSQSCHSSTLSQRSVPTKSSLFPTAAARSQPPCISPWKRAGATFDTNDKPIGLRNSSAIVSTRQILMSQYDETLSVSGTGDPLRR